MSGLRHGFAVLVLAALGACTPLQLTLLPLEQRIDWLVDHQEYGQALAELEKLPQGTPEAADAKRKKRRQIAALIVQYERDVLAEARRRQDKDLLADAFELLDTAARKVPDSTRIRKARDALRSRQAERAREIDERILIASTEGLLHQVPLLNERLRIKTDDSAMRLRKAQVGRQLEKSRSELMECGVRALEDDKLDRAEKCLTLARKIEDKPDAGQVLSRLQEKKASKAQQVRAKKQRSDEAQRQKEAEQLRAQLDDAVAGADLALAQRILSQLHGIGVENEELTVLQRALNDAVAAKVEELLEQGNALYRDEKVREAKNSWEAALALEPGNERIRAHIERADTVLKTLQELQQKSAQ